MTFGNIEKFDLFTKSRNPTNANIENLFGYIIDKSGLWEYRDLSTNSENPTLENIGKCFCSEFKKVDLCKCPETLFVPKSRNRAFENIEKLVLFQNQEIQQYWQVRFVYRTWEFRKIVVSKLQKSDVSTYSKVRFVPKSRNPLFDNVEKLDLFIKSRNLTFDNMENSFCPNIKKFELWEYHFVPKSRNPTLEYIGKSICV